MSPGDGLTSHDTQSLSDRIRETVDTGIPVSDTLDTNQKIIRRVTDGIYREPWAAFRELIANAYDADATRVIVETGAPNFAQVTVRDDGNGMSAETIAYVVKNIGGSSKRTKTGVELHTVMHTAHDRSPGGRPLIGKIGIGLFAVAQLTQHFQIITKARGEDVRTSATIRLKTHDDDADEPSEDGSYVAGTVEIVSERVQPDELDAHGTAIVLYSLRTEIRRSLQSLDRWAATEAQGDDGKSLQEKPVHHIGVVPASGQSQAMPARLPWLPSDSPRGRFLKLFRAAADVSGRSSKPKNLDHFDAYLQLIWKLSLSLPLPYVGKHPFDLGGDSSIIFLGLPLGEKQSVQLVVPKGESLREYLSLKSGEADPAGGFVVLVDEVELFRPIELLETLRVPSRIPAPVVMAATVGPVFKKGDLARAGGQLRFEAYLYWNSRIIPKDTAGVILRVREASGTLFDSDFLGYQVSEQTRLGQITAEIFVLEGLDPAINIDRESFNYSHPHYIYIRKWLHRALRLMVNRLKGIAESHLKIEKQAKEEVRQQTLLNSATRVWEERRGATADPPLRPGQTLGPLAEVAGTEVRIAPAGDATADARALAIAVVLESYGVLSGLTLEDRSSLIADLIVVLDSENDR